MHRGRSEKPSFQPSHHQVTAAWTALPSGHVPIQAVCSALYKGERVDPQWAEHSALERWAEIPPEELSRREAKEPRLYRRSPLPSWDLVLHCESGLHPSPDALGLTFHPMGIWPHVLFLLFPNNLAWCCMETGFPPCPPGPSAQAWPLPCVFTAP